MKSHRLLTMIPWSRWRWSILKWPTTHSMDSRNILEQEFLGHFSKIIFAVTDWSKKEGSLDRFVIHSAKSYAFSSSKPSRKTVENSWRAAFHLCPSSVQGGTWTTGDSSYQKTTPGRLFGMACFNGLIWSCWRILWPKALMPGILRKKIPNQRTGRNPWWYFLRF